MRKASTTRPSGQNTQKLRIINAIQAGSPHSSSFAAIGMASSRVNVNYIYIGSSGPQGCQEEAEQRSSDRDMVCGAGQEQVRRQRWDRAGPGEGRRETMISVGGRIVLARSSRPAEDYSK